MTNDIKNDDIISGDDTKKKKKKNRFVAVRFVMHSCDILAENVFRRIEALLKVTKELSV